MRRFLAVMTVVGAVAATAAAGAESVGKSGHTDAGDDPYVWLEDIHGAKPLEWVKAQNVKSTAVLQADPDYQKDYDAILRVMDATDRIPYGDLDHQLVFNFWQDAEHPKGIWRRTSIADYARQGEVLVSQEVVDASAGVAVDRDGVGGSFSFALIGPVDLKGVADPVRLYAVRRNG